ncbi:12560_t:CDS:10, partial [Cetraspora pellucida]
MKQLVIREDENMIQLSTSSNDETTERQTPGKLSKQLKNLSHATTESIANCINTNNQKTARLILNTIENINVDKHHEGNHDDSGNIIHPKDYTNDNYKHDESNCDNIGNQDNSENHKHPEDDITVDYNHDESNSNNIENQDEDNTRLKDDITNDLKELDKNENVYSFIKFNDGSEIRIPTRTMETINKSWNLFVAYFLNTGLLWLEDSIRERDIKYYVYTEFSAPEEIDEGAHGIVCRSEWKDRGLTVALKRSLKEKTIQNFVKERPKLAEILKALKNLSEKSVIQDDENAIQQSTSSNENSNDKLLRSIPTELIERPALDEFSKKLESLSEKTTVEFNANCINTNNQKIAQLILNTTENINVEKHNEGNKNGNQGDSEDIHPKDDTADNLNEPDEIVSNNQLAALNKDIHLSIRLNNGSEVIIQTSTKTIDGLWNLFITYFLNMGLLCVLQPHTRDLVGFEKSLRIQVAVRDVSIWKEDIVLEAIPILGISEYRPKLAEILKALKNLSDKSVIQDDENAIQQSTSSNNETTERPALDKKKIENLSEKTTVEVNTNCSNTNNQKIAQLIFNTTENINVEKHHEGNKNGNQGDSENIHPKDDIADNLNEPDELVSNNQHAALSIRLNNGSEVVIQTSTKTIDELWNLFITYFLNMGLLCVLQPHTRDLVGFEKCGGIG